MKLARVECPACGRDTAVYPDGRLVDHGLGTWCDAVGETLEEYRLRTLDRPAVAAQLREALASDEEMQRALDELVASYDAELDSWRRYE